MSYGSIYFWTATIHNWHHLLEPDDLAGVLAVGADTNHGGEEMLPRRSN